MALKIKLTEGEELTIDVDEQEWTAAFRKALATGGVLEIEDRELGRTLTINPQSVAYYFAEKNGGGPHLAPAPTPTPATS
jgi:hypothetical protein